MAMDEKITVAIADDHHAVREGVRRLLEQSPEIEVVGEASDGQQALEIVANLAPDVLILDILMPVMDGITVIEMMQAMGAQTAVVVLSAIDDPVFREESIARGACDYLSKDQAPHLIDLVQNAAQGLCEDSEDDLAPPPSRFVMIY